MNNNNLYVLYSCHPLLKEILMIKCYLDIDNNNLFPVSKIVNEFVGIFNIRYIDDSFYYSNLFILFLNLSQTKIMFRNKKYKSTFTYRLKSPILDPMLLAYSPLLT
jgi:hypothetical protein